MTFTQGAPLPGHCPRITGQVAQQAAELLWLLQGASLTNNKLF